MSTQPLTHGTVPQRLAHTRELMRREGIHALLVPSADPHLSEYLPGYWQGRQWLSGFHGSVGTLIVTAEFAGQPLLGTGDQGTQGQRYRAGEAATGSAWAAGVAGRANP